LPYSTRISSADGLPTAVELASFTATAQGGAILLEWETAAELDSLGFDLYRAWPLSSAARTATGGERQRLNVDLIPARAPGSAAGAAYRFLDETAAPGLAPCRV
jgi:hypothetical protein